MEIIKNEREKGRAFINKLSVGERQLAAAIRMYFLELDPLAIHTVSSAAHNVLADLLKDRGKDPSVHGIAYGLLKIAKDLYEEEVTEDDLRARYEDDGALEILQELRNLFEENPGFEIDEVRSSAPPEFAREFWSGRRSSYNYLKHADRDANALLDEATINNEDTVLHAIMCSQHLNMKLTPEKYFFLCAMIALGKFPRNEKKPWDLEILLFGQSKEEIMAFGRKKFCLGEFTEDELLLEASYEKADNNTKIMMAKLDDGTYEDIVFFDFD